MLLELEVKNFALINQLNLQFEKGLNVLTGETGAGKSIIIDAVNMVIGERADRQVVRNGTNKCTIQAIFDGTDRGDIRGLFTESGIDWDEEELIIITREIYANGRSISRINGVLVTQGLLKSITEKLIDIHGQHQHQSLLNPLFHIELLDAFGGDEVAKYRQLIDHNYKLLLKAEGRLKNLCGNEMERERKIDLLRFQLEEIEAAALKIDEEEELTHQRNLLANGEKIYKTVSQAYEGLYEGSNYPSILDNLGNIVNQFQGIASFHQKLSGFHGSLEELQYRLEDLSREIRDFKDNIDFEPYLLNEVEKRLDLINSLKRKYGASIKEILDYKRQIERELDFYTNSEEEIKILQVEIEKIKKDLTEDSLKLSKLRKDIAALLEGELQKIMADLNMPRAQLKVEIQNLVNEEKDLKFSSKGIDHIEFMISTNLGEDLKPLAKIASGGEMSRIMLAIKAILADVDEISTLIFDEIDTGISGNTAKIVGDKLYNIARGHQVICITHLPQIAAQADIHFLIEKVEVEESTVTHVKKLHMDARTKEIGRLLGGTLTDITIKHAEELLNQRRSEV
ncbi:DNA repair protein RecN [Alkaliphilus serpentinus]|uniref:DNA repair protein RecN n=1 Tax=Alkaliphilus serpentinus TaxID=1482731 RepID=A0A833HMG4_9FIRM|nr:DNA repair protein RecN [Alkaliphilus serpentinus]KAB3527561.1 DNA repair protein RecN [Alkaliphilus serpentinus]